MRPVCQDRWVWQPGERPVAPTVACGEFVGHGHHDLRQELAIKAFACPAGFVNAISLQIGGFE